MEGYTFVKDRPTPYFSEEELDTLTERQRIAKASPLRKDSLLPFSRPSLYPEAVYSASLHAEVAANTARHASESLLKLLKDDKVGKLNVKLVKGIQKGSGELSQFAARELIHYKAEGYSSFRAEQGLGVSICYGFYQFNVPWGEKVLGVILEDLSDISIPLSTFAANFLKTGNGFSNESGPDYDSDEEEEQFNGDEEDCEAYENRVQEDAVRKATQLKHFIHELFKAHRGLQDRGFSLPIIHGDQDLVLRSSTLDKPEFVFCAVRRSISKAEVKEESGEIDHRRRGEELLRVVAKHVFGTQLWLEWKKFELFTFV